MTTLENGNFVRRFIIRLRRVASLLRRLCSRPFLLPCLILNGSPVYLPLKLENSWYPVLSESTDRNELASGVGRCEFLAFFTLREISLSSLCFTIRYFFSLFSPSYSPFFLLPRSFSLFPPLPFSLNLSLFFFCLRPRHSPPSRRLVHFLSSSLSRRASLSVETTKIDAFPLRLAKFQQQIRATFRAVIDFGNDSGVLSPLSVPSCARSSLCRIIFQYVLGARFPPEVCPVSPGGLMNSRVDLRLE